ncbi:serine protease [Rhizobium ruizarguesonis]
MRLKHPMLGVFLRGVQSSFNQPKLEALLLERFGLRYDLLTNATRQWSAQVIEIHSHFDFENNTEELVAAVREARPRVLEFAKVADSLGFTVTPEKADLEVLIRQGTRYQDVDVFRAKLASLEAAICQIDAGDSVGTGTLIADDLVLTNHHVIAGKISSEGKLVSSVTCRFDYKTNGAGFTTPALNVPANILLASSPHAPEDLIAGPMANDFSLLDYAILKLDRKLATEPIVTGGDARGRVDVSSPSEFVKNAGLLVLQHPGGKPMKIDLGSVLDLGATRFRHSVNTEPGSSGAPVFDAALRLIGIHHAGQNDGAAMLPYNEGIPLGVILADARAKEVGI